VSLTLKVYLTTPSVVDVGAVLPELLPAAAAT
jgi:hypothetical protein